MELLNAAAISGNGGGVPRFASFPVSFTDFQWRITDKYIERSTGVCCVEVDNLQLVRIKDISFISGACCCGSCGLKFIVCLKCKRKDKNRFQRHHGPRAHHWRHSRRKGCLREDSRRLGQSIQRSQTRNSLLIVFQHDNINGPFPLHCSSSCPHRPSSSSVRFPSFIGW